MADGDEIDIDRFQRTANSLRRLCESLGLERRQKLVRPTLGEILREGIRRGGAGKPEDAAFDEVDA